MNPREITFEFKEHREIVGGGWLKLCRGQITDDTTLSLALAAAHQTGPRFAYDRKRVENPSAYVVDTLRALFHSLFATDSLEGALIDVVNRGGDADTTGAILGVIVGARYGAAALPARWIKHLDKPIRTECTEQAQALLRLSPLCVAGRTAYVPRRGQGASVAPLGCGAFLAGPATAMPAVPASGGSVRIALEPIHHRSEVERPERLHGQFPSAFSAQAADPGTLIGLQGNPETRLTDGLGKLDIVRHGASSHVGPLAR